MVLCMWKIGLNQCISIIQVSICNLRNKFISICRDGYYDDKCSAKYQQFLIIIAYYNYTDFSHISSQFYLLKDLITFGKN